MNSFTLIEKLATLKTLDSVILADGKFDPKEKKLLKKVLNEMELEPSMVEEARKVRVGESLDILSKMPSYQKMKLAEILHQMIIVDGHIDDREVNLIISLYENIGIDVDKPESLPSSPDLTFIYFESSQHNVYKEGMDGSRQNVEASYIIRIELLINEDKKYKVFIYPYDESPSIWGNEIIEKPFEVELRKVGDDCSLFEEKNDGGISIHLKHDGPIITSIVIHSDSKMLDVEYLD